MIFGTLKDGSLKTNSLPLNNFSATEMSAKMASTLCQFFFQRAQNFS